VNTTATERSVVEGIESTDDENSQLFRSVNERIEHLSEAVVGDFDFVCECNDSTCTKVMRMSAQEFQILRSDSSLFAVVPGHEEFEDVAGRTERYVLIRLNVAKSRGTRADDPEGADQ
jgi:hypothetical protein